MFIRRIKGLRSSDILGKPSRLTKPKKQALRFAKSLGFPQAVNESLDTPYASLRSAPFYPPLHKNSSFLKQRKEMFYMEKIIEIVRIKQIVTETEERKVIRCPEDAAKIAASYIAEDDREVFFVMCLNTKNEVIAVHRCHIGSLNASIVHPREVFKSAILNNSASIIVAHQHPSSSLIPSKEDIEITKRLAAAGEILGIPVLDHLVINYKEEYTSLKERGFF